MKYPIKYLVTHGSFTKKQLKETGAGGCDAIIIHSLIFPSDGSRSEVIVSSGSDGKPLNGSEIFKSWISMAKLITECEDLPDQGRKQVAKAVFDHVRDVLKEMRD